MSAQIPAHEHPTIWAYVGEGRYLQAAFCRSTARLYAEQFEKTTMKSLSNIAAKYRQLSLLEWCRVTGCAWDDSLYVSAAGAGSTAVMDWLLQNSCPLPSEPQQVCDAAASSGAVEVLRWLYLRDLWWENACVIAAENGKFDAVVWQLMQNRANTGFYADDELFMELYSAACKGGKAEVLEWLMERGCSWGEEIYVGVKSALDNEHLNILDWLHERDLLPLDEGTVIIAISSRRCDVLEYFYQLGAPFCMNPNGRMGEFGKQILKDMLSALDLGEEVLMEALSCVFAACMGSLELLKLLRAKDCPWDGYTLKVARLFSRDSASHKLVEQWAMENGCPEPDT